MLKLYTDGQTATLIQISVDFEGFEEFNEEWMSQKDPTQTDLRKQGGGRWQTEKGIRKGTPVLCYLFIFKYIYIYLFLIKKDFKTKNLFL